MITQHPAAPAPPTELLVRDERNLNALHTLADASHLTTLWLWSSHLRDLGPLAGLTHLTRLDLAYCLQVRNLSSLAGPSHLTTLTLCSCEQLSNLTSLAGLTQLATLDLSYCPQVSDLSPMAGLAHLTTLSLYCASQVSEPPSPGRTRSPHHLGLVLLSAGE